MGWAALAFAGHRTPTPPCFQATMEAQFPSRVRASSQASENRTVSYLEEFLVSSQCILYSACSYLTGFQPTNSVRQEPFFAYTVMAKAFSDLVPASQFP